MNTLFLVPIVTANFLMEQGATTIQSFFLRRELAESAAMLRQMATPHVADDVSIVDLIGGFYYLMADQRCNPPPPP